MEKTFVKDIREKDQVRSVFQVARKTTMSSKNGKPFLAVVLRDRTGELDARVWENAAELDVKFDRGDLVTVEGPAQSFQGRVQLRIDQIEKSDGAGIDPAEFAAPPKVDHADRNFQQIVELVDRVQDPHIKALLKSFLDDEGMARDFRRAPAAKAIHHAHPGGLCEHTLSTMKLAHRIADHYPMADRDMLLAGAFLHDFGKIRELSWEHGTEYTDEGRLVGHLVMTAQWIHERAGRLPGFPPKLVTHLTHLVLAHHGKLEYGSPRLPQTLEAVLVHYIDEMDSRVASWLEIMAKDQNESWTDFQKLYDRHLYKGAPPTLHGKPPVERKHRERKKRREDRERHGQHGEKPAGGETAPTGEQPAEGAAAATPGAEQHHPRRERPDRPPREARPPRGDRPQGDRPHADRPHDDKGGERREKGPRKEKEEKLTFKPFAALSGPNEPVPNPADAPAEKQAPAAPAEAAPAHDAVPATPPAGGDGTVA